MVQWLYEAFYTAIGDLFADINNLGVEIFDLSWVQAVVNLFTMRDIIRRATATTTRNRFL